MFLFVLVVCHLLLYFRSQLIVFFCSPTHAQASPKNEAKVVHKYAQVANQRPQGVSHHVVAPQAQGVVGQALDVSHSTFS